MVQDLPCIHQLMRDSFDAMIPHSFCFPSFWRNAATELIQSELSVDSFESIYFDSGNCFWVATKDTNVIGCVAVKRVKDEPREDIELVRMSVSPSHQGQGVGRLLFNELLAYCKSQEGVKRIVLTTANPDSVMFYQKCGFTVFNRVLFYHGMIELG